jgi:hypothetical protein
MVCPKYQDPTRIVGAVDPQMSWKSFCGESFQGYGTEGCQEDSFAYTRRTHKPSPMSSFLGEKSIGFIR